MVKLAAALGALALSFAAEAHAGEAPAIAAAKTWYGAVIAKPGSVAAPTKESPLHYATSTGVASCAAVKAGKATSAAMLDKLARCLADAQKELSEGDPPHLWEVTSVEVVKVGFAKRHHKQIAAAAKGATLVNAVLGGYDVYLAVAADGAIRGVWLSENAPG